MFGIHTVTFELIKINTTLLQYLSMKCIAFYVVLLFAFVVTQLARHYL